MERDPEKTAAALLVRRTSLRADPARIDELVGLGRPEAVAKVLNRPLDGATCERNSKSDATLQWWLERIKQDQNGLQDRMTFLWHSIIPTHRYSVNEHELLAIQLNTLRSKALTSFREIMQAMMVDPAMLTYLDAVSSTANKPNENLSREIMELFTVGVENYTEQDVRNGALAMAGWQVDKNSFIAAVNPDRAHEGETTFFGETKKWDIPTIVDRLCDHPATAARIGAKVWYHFTGEVLGINERNALGVWWQNSDLAVKPLLERIFLSNQFWAEHYVRPRSGFEFYCAIQKVLNLDPVNFWQARSLGQLPYEPPNVGGWPTGDRWLTADSLLRRFQQLFALDYEEIRGGTTATVEEILDSCGMYVVNEDLLAELDRVVTEVVPENISQLQWRIVLSCPEFQLQ